MTSEREDFYVGYLPMPPAHRAFLRWVAPSILWTMVVICGITLTFFKPAPPAVWSTGALLELKGMLRTAPYPLIEVRTEAGRMTTVLLTGIGKRGAFVPEIYSDTYCSVRGYPLERDGRRILELMEGSGAITRAGDQSAAWLTPEPLPIGRAEFEGEILDSKCWHGAMKPGEGRAHKACATLCVRGGIAPALIVHSGSRAGEVVILVGAGGGRAADAVLPYLGEPVTVRGEFFRQAGMLWLRLDADGILPRGSAP
ncbi:MAG: hypothetical protein O3A20_00850 [Planctomycetota bacterium]|nr:hypothetical protein [Planctomycetota bacterium]